MMNFISRDLVTRPWISCSFVQSQQLTNKQKRFASHRHPSHDHHRSPTFYYDVLELTPRANQLQIKDAYYKLSKKYHPDVNPTDEGHLKFQQISEAYEVIGKISTRRLYDRGVHKTGHTSHSRTTGHTERNAKYYSDHSKFHSHEGFARRGRGPISGRSNIYDFDEWYNAHYAENRIKKQMGKRIVKEMLEQDEKRKRLSEEKQSIIPHIMGAMVISYIMYLYYKDVG